ncbi:MAG: hypothetical protein ABWY78_11590 [Microvirga sp.]
MPRQSKPAQGLRIVRRILTLPAAVAVAAYLLLSDLVGPVLAPVIRWLAGLRLFVKLRDLLEALTPYQALVVLAVPFLILEPLKLLALVVIARGHVVTGTAFLVGLHGLSLLSTERLFAVVKPRLLTIRWFNHLWGFVVLIRDDLVRRVRSSWIWRLVRGIRRIAALAGNRVLTLMGFARP